jgi:hypothetical protein
MSTKLWRRRGDGGDALEALKINHESSIPHLNGAQSLGVREEERRACSSRFGSQSFKEGEEVSERGERKGKALPYPP